MLTPERNPEPEAFTSLEQALLDLPAVIDGAVLMRELGGQTFALIFVVMATTNQDDRVFDTLPLPTGCHRVIVRMQSLPRTPEGAVDMNALDRMGLVEESSVARLEQVLQALPDVEHGAVLARPALRLPRRLHVSDLLPGATAGTSAEAEAPSVTAADAPASVGSDRPALVEAPRLPLQPRSPAVLGASLARAAERYADPRITYVSDDGQEARQTFATLLAEAEQTLTGLRGHGLAPGDYVLLQLTQPRNIVPTFWACLLGGFIPVICPVAPGYDTDTADLQKLLHVWRLLGRPLVVSEAKLEAQLPHLLRHLEGARTVPIVEKLRDQPRDARHHPAAPDDVAFLTLTSGSTGSPKCIALTHRNILSRARGTNVMCDHADTDVILNWLPFDHIGSISDWHLRCVDLGCHMVYCTKERVLGNPLNWLQLIARFRITHSWAPNFAYALINSALDGAGGETWDLSCMKSLLTAGEAVSSATVQEFLTRLSRFGLASSAVRPAFGMAELGSGITYFRPSAQQPFAALSVDRRSLTGTLQPVPADHPRSISFTALGTVIAGMSMRIVDDAGQVLPENTIGSLHVRGEAVTAGYVQNPEANAKVFVGDGWFDTGDRGFISSSQLFITGRNKETIIVNGANYYPGELEAAAEQVPGLFVSFTAACAVRPPGAPTERVALFLCHEAMPERRQADLLRDVQSSVNRKTGVKPDYLIPLARHQIPKTAIGKIQRKELVRRFEDGEFDETAKYVDCLLENENTLPNWFFRPAWRPRALRKLAPRRRSNVVVMADGTGVADRLGAALAADGTRMLRISEGPDFARISDSHWRVDWGDPAQVTSLCGELRRRRMSDFEVVDLTGYGPVPTGGGADRQAIEESLQRGCFRTLNWLQALIKHELAPAHYWVVSSGAQPGAPGGGFEPGRALAISLLKACEHAVENFNLHHIDVPGDDPNPSLWQVVLEEMRSAKPDQQVAYRDGARLVSGIELVDWRAAPRTHHPLLDNGQGESGFCLVTGGLGGIGIEVARLLLRRRSRVLLVGRSSAPVRYPNDKLAELERLGNVMYQQADVTVPEDLERAVASAQAAWRVGLGGVFHLAGIGREAPLLEETPQTVLPVLAPKVFGTCAIERLLAQNPSAYCVLFSSAVTITDTSQTAVYAMANAYLDGWAAVQRQRGRLVHCFNWAPWEDLGMNAGWTVSPALRAKGLESIPVRAGLNSMLAGLGLAEARLIVGLDPDNPRVNTAMHQPQGAAAMRLEAFFSRRETAQDVQFPRSIEGRDAFDRPLHATLQEFEHIPLNPWVGVDKAALAAQLSGATREKKPPKDEVERKLVEVFARVLGVEVGVNESFFDLGGTSLLSLNLFGEIEREFGVRLGAATLFEAPTVAQIATKLDPQNAGAAPGSLMKITVDASGPPLFLIHDADGETILYRSLALALPGTSVFALKPHAALHTSVEQMSKYYIDQIREAQPEGPYMVGGLCAGGVIAFDIACRLQAARQDVPLVVLLDAADSRAPKASLGEERANRLRSTFKEGGFNRRSLVTLGRKMRNAIKYEVEQRVIRIKNRLKISLLRETQGRGMKPPRLLKDLSPRTLYEFAQERHEPGTFKGQLLLFRATKADAVQMAEGFDDRPAIETIADPLLGWAHRATNGVEVVDVPGGHSSMLQPPNVTVLAEELRQRIGRTKTGDGKTGDR
jgi:acyl-CoA synthetase (AMP-forming)/AMP-acid ligase II/thioesterase domain-containing protein/NAD(P)-dependent dehydrogenase (short-subunit alcohol dehydrogenase family)/acyl carrier protein